VRRLAAAVFQSAGKPAHSQKEARQPSRSLPGVKSRFLAWDENKKNILYIVIPAKAGIQNKPPG